MTHSHRPNILLVHSDQHRYDCIGAHGMRDVQTPNLDGLLRGGVGFSRAYSTIPICTPARASLMTGAWPTTHGSISIPSAECGRPAERDLPVLTQLMADAGYRTGWVGKFHNEVEGGPTDHGVEEYVGANVYMKNTPKVDGRNRPGGLFGSVAEQRDDQTPLHGQAEHVLRMIDERKDGPFFIRWDPPEPHLPVNPNPTWFSKYNPGSIPPWESWGDTLEGKPPAQMRQRDIWGLHDFTWEDWQTLVAYYYAIITEMDHHIGRIIQKLKDIGQYENTLILYSTDHGDFCGGHNLIDKHFSMYDDITHVPMIISWPGKVPEGETRDAYVSNSIDIAATILEAAGIERPATYVGENLVELANNPELQPRTEAFSQYFGTESGSYSSRMIRRDRFKLIYNPTAFDEFYDLEADPGEKTNLIDAPEHQGTVRELRSRLWHLMKEVGDRLANRWTAVHLDGGQHQADTSGILERLRRDSLTGI